MWDTGRVPRKLEFRCLQCEQRLRVASIHSGKWLSCPVCRSGLTVPSLDENDPELKANLEAEAAEVSPIGGERLKTVWLPQSVPLSRILRDTWTIYVENLWMLLAVSLIDFMLWIVGAILILIPAVGTFAVMWRAIGIPQPFSLLGMFIVAALGFMYLLNAMTCSQAKFFLKVARGEPASVFDAFHIEWKAGSITMLPTIFAAMSVTGLLLFIFPGVLVYLFFWPFISVWADNQTAGRDNVAFPLAKDLTTRNIGTSLTIATIGIAMMFLGLTLLGQSLFGVLKAVAYLRMSGQEVTGIRDHWESEMLLEHFDPA